VKGLLFDRESPQRSQQKTEERDGSFHHSPSLPGSM
jgi:hypothetical protein